ncbi:Putative epidermal cell surface receptor [Lepeophtheirus salmonis]|uniref:Epidermal cell surface receptor n=1 Tax=Lepeophtheirus salmonis TaxID=72036 RepID=A0A7R8D2W9_LEPSM|nr:Putative epidermal cell surface receptor [Lepeophtheirus salmonis]CAF3005740.1 Putative epidermal cell surface receptor [Lepeophtheirus salmonis]
MRIQVVVLLFLSVSAYAQEAQPSLIKSCDCDPICEPVERCTNLIPRKDCSCCQICGDESQVCVYEEKIHAPNATFYSSDCSSHCSCSPTGDVFCAPIQCPPILHKKGTFKDDPYCHESMDHPDADECCVIALCEAVVEEENETHDPFYDNDDHSILVEEPRLIDDSLIVTETSSASPVVVVEKEDEKERTQVSEGEEINLEFLQITSMTIQVKFPGISGGNLMYVEDHLYKGETRNKAHGGVEPGTLYRLRWQAPDKQYPDLKVSTHEYSEKLPKIIVTRNDFKSATLSFDHYAPVDYNHGYVARYRLKKDLPTVTLDGLLPESKYVAKVSIYADYPSREFGISTGEVEFKTNMGCVYKNASYPIGIFNIECETSCNCAEDGTVECGERCKHPSLQKWCSRKRSSLVHVKGSSVVKMQSVDMKFFRGESAETICVCKEGYTGDPDSDSGCSPNSSQIPSTKGTDSCVAKNETYAMGEHWFDGCDYKCYCSEKLEIFCQPRCKNIPSAKIEGCELRTDTEDDCCQVLYCPSPNSENDLKPVIVPFDGCIFKNESYRISGFYDGCDQQCQCMGYGDKVCLPRCPPTAPAPGQKTKNVDKQQQEISKTPRILNRPSKETIIEGTEFEGISLGEFETLYHNVKGHVYAYNESTLFIQDFSYDGTGPDAYFWIGINSPTPNSDGLLIQYPDNGENDSSSSGYEVDAPVLGAYDKENIVLRLPEGITADQLKWISVWCRAFAVDFGHLIIPQDVLETVQVSEKLTQKEEDLFYPITETLPIRKKDTCLHKGQEHQRDQVFYDGCEQFCVCLENGETYCNPIECPSDFGLDVINPFCLEWNEHKDFIAEVPMCCPPVPVCISDGTCQYSGYSFKNYDNIPQNLTGCEKSCYCNDGEVQCQDACNSLPEEPPSYLPCIPEQSVIQPKEDRPCCNMWTCTKLEDLPDTIEGGSAYPLNSTFIEIELEAPRALGGRPGFYKILLGEGSEAGASPEEWTPRVVTPENGIFSLQPDGTLRLVLGGLLPEQKYFLRVDVHIKTSNNDARSPLLLSLSRRQAIFYLKAERIEPHSALVTWRYLTLYEKNYIDGVQIRYNSMENGEETSQVPETTPFIHRDTIFYQITELASNTEYKVDLYFIPVSNTTVEYTSIPQGGVLFKTSEPRVDPYDFKLKLNADDIGDRWMRLSWSGIPNPYQKYVSIFRLAYMEVNDVESRSIFKIANMETDNILNLLHLEPSTPYQVWLEAYLTNGRVAKSELLDISTKEGVYTEAESEGLKENPRLNNGEEVDTYYGSMVTAVVFAVLFALALLAISFLYLRRTTTYKAIISGGAAKMSKNNNGQDNQSTSIPMSSQNGNNTDRNGKKLSDQMSSI